MSHITADATLLAYLSGISSPVEIRDQDGNTIGHYTPTGPAEHRALYETAKGLFDIAKAKEILARERDQGRPLKDILVDLQTREQPR